MKAFRVKIGLNAGRLRQTACHKDYGKPKITNQLGMPGNWILEEIQRYKKFPRKRNQFGLN